MDDLFHFTKNLGFTISLYFEQLIPQNHWNLNLYVKYNFLKCLQQDQKVAQNQQEMSNKSPKNNKKLYYFFMTAFLQVSFWACFDKRQPAEEWKNCGNNWRQLYLVDKLFTVDLAGFFGFGFAVATKATNRDS